MSGGLCPNLIVGFLLKRGRDTKENYRAKVMWGHRTQLSAGNNRVLRRK